MKNILKVIVSLAIFQSTLTFAAGQAFRQS